MLRASILLLSCLFLVSCGVKLPPLAPERPPFKPKLDCSPQQEDCDKEDPNYRPRSR